MDINTPVFSNDGPLILIAGVNVIESEAILFEVAETLHTICTDINITLVFKASFDKANRSSSTSFRGPGLQKGLLLLQKVKEQFRLPIITDIHEPWQAKPVSEVANIIQIPAFLSRQTDLIQAACHSNRMLHIKKMQLMAPMEMRNIIEKCVSFGNRKLILCERGTMFGYNNLIVDPLSFVQLKQLGYPVSFDVTHSLQQPGALQKSTGGRGQYVQELALAGISQGLSSLFLETHPDPSKAKCDGPCALPLNQVKPFLEKIKELDTLIKSWG